MPQISMIVALDDENGIGKNNQLLCHLPIDLAHFKKTTMGKPILMGRKTFESIGKALPGRLNVVVSRTPMQRADVFCYLSIEEALSALNDYPEIMVIGGAEIYRQMLPLASTLYITRIHHHFDADAYFPKWDINEWQTVAVSTHKSDEKNPYSASFYTYRKIEI